MSKKEDTGAGPQPERAAGPIDERDAQSPPRAVRHHLPVERASLTHKFNIAGHEGYITVGLYPDGQPGEIFITMAKEGSTISGLMDSFALAISIALQHGVPLKLLCEKFSHTRFEPSGWTTNADIGYAKSIMDYIFRWLQLRFIEGQQGILFEGLRPKSPIAALPEENGSSAGGDVHAASSMKTAGPRAGAGAHTGGAAHIHAADALKNFVDLGDAPTCHVCGAIMTRNGSCYRCMSCGSTSGCS